MPELTEPGRAGFPIRRVDSRQVKIDLRVPSQVTNRGTTGGTYAERHQGSSGAWNPDQHPELAQGGAAFVERIRSEPDERFKDAVGQNPAS